VKGESNYLKLALAWFSYLPLVSKLLLFFGCLLLLAGLFGFLPPRTIFSVRLMCLGLSWDYFFRFNLAGMNKVEYQDGTVRRNPWVEWRRIVGGIVFFAFAVAPNPYWMWIYRHLSS
jgi:hypothetical protein